MANKCKSSKKPLSAATKRAMDRRPPALVTLKAFPCLFCNLKESVSIKITKVKNGPDLWGKLGCWSCGVTFECPTHYLASPVDVYSSWVDASDDVNRRIASDSTAQAASASELSIVSSREYLASRRAAAAGPRPGPASRNARQPARPASPETVARRLQEIADAKEQHAIEQEQARIDKEQAENDVALAWEDARQLPMSEHAELRNALIRALGNTRGNGAMGQSPASPETVVDGASVGSPEGTSKMGQVRLWARTVALQAEEQSVTPALTGDGDKGDEECLAEGTAAGAEGDAEVESEQE